MSALFREKGEAFHSIASDLQAARQSKGLSLSQASQETGIKKTFIVSMEKGDFGFSRPFLVRSCLRSYANQMGVEPSSILGKIRRADHADRGVTSPQKVLSCQTDLSAAAVAVKERSPDPSAHSEGESSPPLMPLLQRRSRKRKKSGPIPRVRWIVTSSLAAGILLIVAGFCFF
jgi:cytoskeletal protein RodZ